MRCSFPVKPPINTPFNFSLLVLSLRGGKRTIPRVKIEMDYRRRIILKVVWYSFSNRPGKTIVSLIPIWWERETNTHANNYSDTRAH